MAGIYFHIPFCKKACHYCNFHFSTSLKYKNEMIESLLCELKLRKEYLNGEKIETIYFGGGTPSLLDVSDIDRLLNGVYEHYSIDSISECTLEANPDDISTDKIKSFNHVGIDRLSIGIQSFYDEDLRYMNRAHNAHDALRCIQIAQDAGIENISADLIFGYPMLTHEKWHKNIETMMKLEIPHLSCYAMTIEPKTALASLIKKGNEKPVNHEQSAEQYEYLMYKLEEHGFEHYEISSFSKPCKHAIHNSNYWNGKQYIGIGPSAHSYNGISRQWNIANNMKYLHGVETKQLDFEQEILSREEKMNDQILTQLRTSNGISINTLKEQLFVDEWNLFDQKLTQLIETEMIQIESEHIKLTQKGKLFADWVASELFL
jgi:oxygen-independent coproporphyrinogen-3 oxidase